MRKLLFLFLFAALLTNNSCSRSTAGLQLAGQQQFLLGEYMETPYTASMRNDGPEAILITTVDKQTKAERQRVELAVGEKAELSVPPTEETRLYNFGDRESSIFINMNKTVEGMRMLDLDGDELPPTAMASANAINDRALFEAKSTRAATDKHDVQIPGGYEFVVGESSVTGYSAKLINYGGKDITVSVRDKATGDQTQGFGLGKYGKVNINLGPNEQLHVENREGRERRITLQLSKEVAGARTIPVL
ncbi:hypothetical protein [Lewinella sp. 4G2]|uniref:hypothetical protein n=1 Tax=Lewinella sp. 4G2 TaxID=1803372 RepID=UPI0007B4A3CC|nr:hypothetical protein [Lewinella sp. 4G2]OAV43150.1 hypothetical protein A3850_000965 [Lewinella sp. 4G2]